MRLNALLVVFSQLTTALAPLLTMPHLTRTVGAEGLGVYSFSFSIAAVFMILGQLGAQLYGRREIAATKDRFERTRVFWELSSLVFRASILMIIIYLVIVYFFIEVDRVLNIALLIQIIYLLSGALDVSWLLHGVERFRLVTLAVVSARVVNVILIFAVVSSPDDTLIYVAIMCSTNLLSSLLPWVILPKLVGRVQLADILSFRHLKPLKHFIIPAVALQLFGSINIAIIGSILSTTDVGFYDLAFRLARSPITLITAVGIVLLPRVTRLHTSGNTSSSDRYLHRGMALTMFIASIISFGLVGTANSFIPIFAGDSFESSVVLLQVIALSLLTIGWGNVLRTQIILPRGIDHVYSMSLVSGLTVSGLLSLALVFPLGVLGAAIGFVIGELVVAIIQAFCIRKLVPLRKLLQVASRYLLSGLIACMAMWSIELFSFSSLITLTVQIATGILVYVLMVFITEYLAKDLIIVREVNRVGKIMRRST